MKLKDYATSSSYGWGALTAALGALSLNEWAMVVGIICTLVTCIVNWHYKRKEFELRVKETDDVTSPQ